MDKIYPFRGRGFHTPVEWKIGYKVINKQTNVQILIMNTAFYIYGNIRVKEISILNSFEQIQENTITGSAFSARLGSSAVAFIPYRILWHCSNLSFFFIEFGYIVTEYLDNISKF